MKKQNLKTGMMVVQRNGIRKWVFKSINDDNEGVIRQTDGSEWGNLKNYSDDLKNISIGFPKRYEYDIMEVYASGGYYEICKEHGELLWKREEEGKFKDLQKAFNEGALIEYKGAYPWDEVVPTWDDDFMYRIKGGISIASWNAHKDVIKAYWNGEDIQMEVMFKGWKDITDKSNGEPLRFFAGNNYRVKPIKELTLDELEKELGYKIRIVGEK